MTATYEDRFWSKVDTTGDCWVWTAAKTNGYGIVRTPGGRSGSRAIRAHRQSWMFLVGEVPAGKELDHLCRNRACVNPDHLEPVSGVTNIMRGEGFGAQNARKTHCANGHEYSPENTGRVSRGDRYCRTCARVRAAARKKAARLGVPYSDPFHSDA